MTLTRAAHAISRPRQRRPTAAPGGARPQAGCPTARRCLSCERLEHADHRSEVSPTTLCYGRSGAHATCQSYFQDRHSCALGDATIRDGCGHQRLAHPAETISPPFELQQRATSWPAGPSKDDGSSPRCAPASRNCGCQAYMYHSGVGKELSTTRRHAAVAVPARLAARRAFATSAWLARPESAFLRANWPMAGMRGVGLLAQTCRSGCSTFHAEVLEGSTGPCHGDD